MLKTCGHCDNEFEAKRDTAQYCSSKCRKLAFLKKPVSVPTSFDDIYSPDYDLSEEGFIRRNRNWLDFSDGFRERIKSDAKRIMKRVTLELKKAIELRESFQGNPLTNSALAPKK